MTVVPLPTRPNRSEASLRGVSIRELSARTGATLRALRHYEELGLLTAGRNARGARCYDADQRRDADLITGLRRLGMPLRDIHTAVAGDLPPVDRAAVVARFLADEATRTASRLQDLRVTLTTLETSGLDGLVSAPATRRPAPAPVEMRHVR
ncbi:MAG: MerR family transcriptional regulator [Caulobacteraceae bacterium]|nr:MAG: MerR family transcriptional regulator [Caulobacteraceae bacterium]